MDESSITLTSRDGLTLHAWRWAPAGTPRAVVQIQHGLAEHGARYRRFGEALTAAGYLVYAPDARGSGRSAAGNYGDWGPTTGRAGSTTCGNSTAGSARTIWV